MIQVASDAEAAIPSTSSGNTGASRNFGSSNSTSCDSRCEKRKATPASKSTSRKIPRMTAGSKVKTKSAREWKRVDLTSRMKDRFQWHVQPFDTSNLPENPVELFELFFDDDVVEMIVKFSNMYAQSKGNHSFSTTTQEVRTFLAILMVSGYNRVPWRQLYWSHDDDVRNVAISSVITRDRFDEMMRYLHISDNTHLDTEDRMAKVRPLLVMLNERFLTCFIKTQNLSIDESMIPYYCRHGAKQFLRAN